METLFFGFLFFGLPIWLCYRYAFVGTETKTRVGHSSYYVPRRHYVYTHSINGKVFYVGKGFKDRAWSTLSRNYYWWRWVNFYYPDYLQEGIPIPRHTYNDKIVVNIIKDNMHYSDAYEYEKQIIEQYGVDNLTNILKGYDSIKQEYSKQPMPKRV